MLYDIVIIGGGVSGFAAALNSGRFNMKTAVISEKLGGTIVLTNDVTNYPGFKQITGFDLAKKIREHALDYGVELIQEKATKVERCKDGCFKIQSEKKLLNSKAVIFATGTEWRKLGISGETKFANRGVHYCALCDGPFYQDKAVAVIGGSDSAAKEALMLAQHAKKVFIIYRKEKIRAEPVNSKRVEENKKIEIIPNTNVLEVKGDKFVSSVMLDKAYNGSKELKLDGIFVSIGHVPLSGLAKSIGVNVNEKDEIIIDKESKTNIAGVFAAGDVADTVFKQAITGVGEGVKAAYTAYQYITQNKVSCICDE